MTQVDNTGAIDTLIIDVLKTVCSDLVAMRLDLADIKTRLTQLEQSVGILDKP